MRARTALIVAVLAGSAVGADPAVSAPTLDQADVAALAPAGRGKDVARAALRRGVPRSLRRARTSGAAFAGAGRRLRTGVFVLPSPGRARRALRVAAKGLAGAGSGRYARGRVTGSAARANVVLRAGRAVAAVEYSGPRAITATGARRVALAYAQTLEARVRAARGRTAWERVVDAIGDDGSVTPALAARAVAVAYGPIPGARPPAGAVGTPEDGTLALQLAARTWSGLSGAQREAIEGLAGAGRAVRQGTLTPDPALQAAADSVAEYFTQQMGVPAPAIDVFVTEKELTTPEGQKINGDALPVDANGNWGVPAVSCRVRVTPIGQAQAATALTITLAHEVFHCFQYTLTDFTTLAPWLLEGTAAWAGLAAAGAEDKAKALGYYSPYLKAPSKPLFGRAYDAVGFWSWAEQTGGAALLFSRMPAILTAGSNEAAFAVAGPGDPGFLDGWASATFRYPDAGPAWNQVRPVAVPFKEVAPPATIVDADTTLAASAFTVRQYDVVEDASKPLLEVRRDSGHLRAGTPKQDLGPVGEDWFCFGTCECKAGEAGTIPAHRPVGDGLLSLGQTGGATDGLGSIAYHSLDEFCDAAGTGVTVSGATEFSITEPGYCVRPSPDVFQVQMPLNAGGEKVAQVVLEVSGFSGAGEYPTGPSVATVYDFRAGPDHLWETPVSGTITIQDPGGAAGEGASGTVSSVTSGTSPDLGTSTVNVSGAWRCVG